MTEQLIETRYRVMRADGTSDTFSERLPSEPGYDLLRNMVLAAIGRNVFFEHVSVWADFDEGEKFTALDMFVDEEGLLKNLPRNEAATTIYRRANLMGKSAAPIAQHPEKLNFIVGTAILFERRVWF